MGHLYLRVTEDDTKLSVLPVSMSACKGMSLTRTWVTAKDKDRGEAASVRDDRIEFVERVLTFEVRQTLRKCPFLLHPLQIASLAGHLDRG